MSRPRDLALSFAALLLAACAIPLGEDVDGASAAATPPDPSRDPLGFAQSCGRLFKRHASVRSVDLAQGVIRWGCGDVPGVTDPDLGQEYCEYQAVQNGHIVKRAADLGSGPVTCVFTSVFGQTGAASRLKPQMADAANLGVAAVDNAIVEMHRGDNNRNAAIDLVRACSATGARLDARLRAAACYQAWVAGGPNAAELEPLCRGSLADDDVWRRAQALGATIAPPGDPAYDEQRDLAGCMAVRGAGTPWRNSDPMICSRVSRATTECSCDFEPVPGSVEGFAMTGWVDDQIPTSCRFAKVDGAPYPYLVLCTLSDSEVADLPTDPQHARAIANFCHDRFAGDLVMKLPLRALERSGSCGASAGYCADYFTPHAP